MECKLCHEDFRRGVECSALTVEIDGQPVARVPFDGRGGYYFCPGHKRDTTDGRDFDGPRDCTLCHDPMGVFCDTCQVPLGSPHHKKACFTCEREICPKCGGLLSRCGSAGACGRLPRMGQC